ncbi:MAG: ATPase domain-containing protein [Thermoproteota archaeon]|nr:AAA family ATPase [Candidatus Brockarchaeota archaeon]
MRKLSSGIKQLDELTGGLPTGVSNLVYGSPGTGKTTISLTLVAEALKNCRENDVVIVVKTEEWDPDRLKTICLKRGIREEALTRIKMYQASGLFEQHKAIIETIPREVDKNDWVPVLIIVDSLVPHYHAQLLNTPIQRLASTARILQGKLSLEVNTLVGMATGYESLLLITSWRRSEAARSFQEKSKKEVAEHIDKKSFPIDPEAGFGAREFDVIGGQHLVYMSKSILRMVSTSLGEDVKAVILEKSLSKPSMTCCLVRITEAGIEPYKDVNPAPVAEMIKKKILKE